MRLESIGIQAVGITTGLEHSEYLRNREETDQRSDDIDATHEVFAVDEPLLAEDWVVPDGC